MNANATQAAQADNSAFRAYGTIKYSGEGVAEVIPTENVPEYDRTYKSIFGFEVGLQYDYSLLRNITDTGVDLRLMGSLGYVRRENTTKVCSYEGDAASGRDVEDEPVNREQHPCRFPGNVSESLEVTQGAALSATVLFGHEFLSVYVSPGVDFIQGKEDNEFDTNVGFGASSMPLDNLLRVSIGYDIPIEGDVGAWSFELALGF